MDRSGLFVMVKEIKVDLSLSDFQIGLLQGIAFMLFYATFGIPIGAAVDRYPRRWIMYLGVTGWSLAAASGALTTTFAQLFAARMMVGLGESSLGPAVASLAADIFPPRRLAAVMATYVAASMIGTATSLGVSGWLLDNVGHIRSYLPALLGHLVNWRLALLAMTLPGLPVALLALTLPEPTRRKAHSSPDIQSSWSDLQAFAVEHRAVLFKLLLGYALLGMGSWPAIVWTPAYARRVLDMSPTEIGAIMAGIIATVGVASALLQGVLVDYLFARGHKDSGLWVGTLAGLIAVVPAVLAFTIPNVAALIIGLIAIQALPQSQFGPALAIIQHITPPRLRGRVTATLILAWSVIAVALGPMVVGFLTDYLYRSDGRVGWSIATLAAVCLPLSAYLLWSARAQYRQCLSIRPLP
jgi:MFS family permease